MVTRKRSSSAIAAACLGVLTLTTVGVGCGPSLGGQVRASMGRYEIGNFNSAATICSDIAGDGEADLNAKAHVRYLVYCGLTHYQLGDRQAAHPMLAQGAQEYVEGRASWLKPAIVDELYKALDDLDGRGSATAARRRAQLSATPVAMPSDGTEEPEL